MIIYTGLCGRQRSQTLWEEGGVKVDMLSLALKWNGKEDQLDQTKKQKKVAKLIWNSHSLQKKKKNQIHIEMKWL